MPLRPDLSQHSILITGAGRGLGRSMAEKLAGCGAAVAIVDVDAGACSVVADGIRAGGGQAFAFPADVADRSALLDVAARFAAGRGRIDAVINNAMLLRYEPIEQITEETLDAHGVDRHQRQRLGRAGAARALRPGARRRDHQHGLAGGRARLSEYRGLQPGQGRDRHADQGAGGRARAAGRCG